MAEPMVRLDLARILSERNITQKKLSELTGIRESTISIIIRNNTDKINYRHLALIMSALNVADFNDILKGTWL